MQFSPATGRWQIARGSMKRSVAIGSQIYHFIGTYEATIAMGSSEVERLVVVFSGVCNCRSRRKCIDNPHRWWKCIQRMGGMIPRTTFASRHEPEVT
jgi:hypothetical protein